MIWSLHMHTICLSVFMHCSSDAWFFYSVDCKALAFSRMFHKIQVFIKDKCFIQSVYLLAQRMNFCHFRADSEWYHDNRFWTWRQRSPPTTDSGNLLWRMICTAGYFSWTGTGDSRRVQYLSYTVAWWAHFSPALAALARWCWRGQV